VWGDPIDHRPMRNQHPADGRLEEPFGIVGRREDRSSTGRPTLRASMFEAGDDSRSDTPYPPMSGRRRPVVLLLSA